MSGIQQSQGQPVVRLLGSLALGVGAILPWGENTQPGNEVRPLIVVHGMPAGPELLGIVVIGVAVGVGLITVFFGNGMKTAIFTVLGGAIGLAIAGEFLWTFQSLFGRFEPAIGVYVTLGAGALLVVSGGVRLLRLDKGIATAIVRRTQG